MEWVRCSERLPDKPGEYLVYIPANAIKHFSIDRYCLYAKGGPHWHYNEDWSVEAWMAWDAPPLPTMLSDAPNLSEPCSHNL